MSGTNYTLLINCWRWCNRNNMHKQRLVESYVWILPLLLINVFVSNLGVILHCTECVTRSAAAAAAAASSDNSRIWCEHGKVITIQRRVLAVSAAGLPNTDKRTLSLRLSYIHLARGNSSSRRCEWWSVKNVWLKSSSWITTVITAQNDVVTPQNGNATLIYYQERIGDDENE